MGPDPWCGIYQFKAISNSVRKNGTAAAAELSTISPTVAMPGVRVGALPANFVLVEDFHTGLFDFAVTSLRFHAQTLSGQFSQGQLLRVNISF